MVNEIQKFLQKNQKTIGIIAIIILGLGIFIKQTGIQVPIFTGSIFGGGFSFLSFGGILFMVGFLMLWLAPDPVSKIAGIGLALAAGGLMIAGGSVLGLIGKLIDLLGNPIFAIIVGLIVLFFIFRKRGR